MFKRFNVFMKLSIIILNYNTRGMLRQCLKAIKKNPPDFSYEIIVVDNKSSDASAAMVRQDFPDVELKVMDKNYGYAGGNNRGLQAAKGEYLAILNPDVLVLSGSLNELVQYLEKHFDAGIVGPKLLNPDKTLQYSCYRFPTLWTPVLRRTFLGFLPLGRNKVRDYLMADWPHEAPRSVDWLLGGAIMIRRRAYEQVGTLDERFFLYFDDVDYARRMREAGWGVAYAPKAEMIHFHNRESAGALFSFFTNPVIRIHISSALKYFWKWRKRMNRKSVQ